MNLMNTKITTLLSLDKPKCYPSSYVQYALGSFLTENCCDAKKDGKCGQNEGNCLKQSDCLDGHICGTNNCKF